jgi:hypothetical protein
MSPSLTPNDYRLPHYKDLIPIVLAVLKDHEGAVTTSGLYSLK